MTTAATNLKNIFYKLAYIPDTEVIERMISTPRFMAATPETTKEVVSLKALEKMLLARREVVSQVTELRPAGPFGEVNFKKSLAQLISLHKQNRLSDEDFETLIYVVCAAYIDKVVEVKVRKLIDEKFYGIFNSRLSTPKLIDLLQ